MTDSTDIGTRFHLHDGNLTVERFQDCTPIAEHTKALHREGMHGSSEMRLAAKIPNVVIETYCNVHNITYSECMQNPEHFRRMLNDPALADFRVWKGRV